MHRDTNPPLHYVILKIWMDWFRYSESTARSLSLLATAISAGAVFAMAQGCTPGVKAFPILAAMLFLLSAYIAYYAIEARPYALWIMFVAIATVGLLGYLRQLHQGRRLRSMPAAMRTSRSCNPPSRLKCCLPAVAESQFRNEGFTFSSTTSTTPALAIAWRIPNEDRPGSRWPADFR